METNPLRNAFEQREKRFLLLDKGFQLAEFRGDALLVEIGCAGGAAAKHLSGQGFSALHAIDIDADILEKARKKAPSCRFLCADACAMPFPDGCFDGIFSEAAFALIPDKASAAAEYFRTLKKHGRVLLNDFALKQESPLPRQNVPDIPMLSGVQTMDAYREIFLARGFTCIYEKEEFAELVRIAVSFSRIYHVPPSGVGQHISALFGHDDYVSDFFSHSRMSYCQMIFEKE